MTTLQLTPRLIVRDAAKALDVYCEVFDAEVIEKYADPNLGDLIVHSAIKLNEVLVAVVDEHAAYKNLSPETIGGSPVLLHLTVSDPDAIAEKMVEAGGEVIVEVRDQFYGRREGRVRDPFGHLWIVGRDIEELSPEEIQRRLDG